MGVTLHPFLPLVWFFLGPFILCVTPLSLFPLLSPFSYVTLFFLIFFSSLRLKKLILLVFLSLFFAAPYGLLHLIMGTKEIFSLMGRLVLISTLSLSLSFVFDYAVFINYLMVKRILAPSFGYTFLMAFRSLESLQEDWRQIVLMGRQRGMKGLQLIFLLIPLFVTALRSSQRAALSLSSRGLNNQKVFYFEKKYLFQKKDRVLLGIYLGVWGLVFLGVLLRVHGTI